MGGETIPDVMKAVVTTGHGGLDKLDYREDVPVPRPGPGEVLIAVGACGMNNTDINTRTAGIAFPRIQGADVAGRVVALGEGSDGSLLGRRVMIDTWLRDWGDPLNKDKASYFGSECDGGYAEYTVAPEKNVHPLESSYSDVELATFATSYITAENMLARASVGNGDVVLIPGASGGVGSALIQLVRRRGGIPIALCGESKAAAVKEIGAEAVLPREPEDLAAALKAVIGQESVDVVADIVGGSLWPQLIEVLRRGGRYTCAGAIAGPIVEFDLRTFYLNDLVFTGATVGG